MDSCEPGVPSTSCPGAALPLSAHPARRNREKARPSRTWRSRSAFRTKSSSISSTRSSSAVATSSSDWPSDPLHQRPATSRDQCEGHPRHRRRTRPRTRRGRGRLQSDDLQVVLSYSAQAYAALGISPFVVPKTQAVQMQTMVDVGVNAPRHPINLALAPNDAEVVGNLLVDAAKDLDGPPKPPRRERRRQARGGG